MGTRGDDEDVQPLLHNEPDNSNRPVKIPIDRTVVREKANTKMRTAILVWLTLQNSIHTLLIRYSRAREVDEMFTSTIIKLVMCLMMVIYEETPRKFFSTLNSQVINQPGDTLKVCIPAMIYTVQNNLFYVAASHLDAATFMITSQMKIFTTAIFSVIMLGRSLNKAQWVALFVLFVGVSLVQSQTSNVGNSSNDQSPVIGFTAVIVACCLSGFAGIYFEKILKGSAPVSLWMRNVQMSVFAIPASLIAVLVQDGDFVRAHGMLYGFDFIVWLTVFWYGIGGLSVAVCIKYADNIAKNFATSVAILLATLGSVWLFGFVPSLMFMLGAALVILSIFLYSNPAPFIQIFSSEKTIDG
ncbi:unnamed protein product, partial [Mesorhabditis belari]|uniref:UDP-galactose transporter n=1 Tax=Mesorhabditis belari TaxID=2138241 RepID=A0AAF3FI00_9BILA